MNKPKKFFAIHSTTKEVREFEIIELAPYRRYGIADEQYGWVIYIDTRYAAKLRLYNFINKIAPKKYRPFDGTEIGKTQPILNF